MEVLNFLSKSSFIRGVQCERSFYLHKHHPSWRDRVSVEQKAKFNRGHRVGELAQRLFPGGKLAYVPSAGRQAGLARTAALIEQGATTLYEAAFEWQGVLVILDILHKRDGDWFAYEVKSSVRISETYELDASLQYYIITNSGLAIKDISIIYVNEAYERGEELDLQELFTTKSVLGLARFNEPFLKLKIDSLRKVYNQPVVPETDIGLHCSRPYECDFKNYCWSHVPKPSVFDIQGMADDKKFALYYNGTQQAAQVPDTALSDFHQKIQVQAYRDGKDVILTEPLRQFLEDVPYPRYYLHVEYLRPAIPLYKGTRPYQPIPYLLSLGYHANAGAALRQTSLVLSTAQPFEEAGEWLQQNTSKTGRVLAFGMQHWPQSSGLGSWDELKMRLADISLPFKEKWVYKESFHGRWDKQAVYDGLQVATLQVPPLTNATAAQDVFMKRLQSYDLFMGEEWKAQLMSYAFYEMHKTVAIAKALEEKLLA
jgi:hypothetical protein